MPRKARPKTRRMSREEIVSEALTLLNRVGLDSLSTRRLAKKLGIESASLYWHFKNKSELLNEMAAAVLARQPFNSPPEDANDWQNFFLKNARDFREILLTYRDGARLHAGSTPTASEIGRILPKVEYLVRAGFTQRDAGLALYSASQFTIGCVLEEQASVQSHQTKTRKRPVANEISAPPIRPSANEAFEFGIDLLVKGLDKKRRAK